MRSWSMMVVGLVGLLALSAPLEAAEHTRDTPATIKLAVGRDSAVLLDVREMHEWDAGHLRDAKLLPLSVLEGGVKPEELARFLPKNRIVYCHCGSGVRCLKAADILRKQGYDVRPLEPGFRELLQHGFAPAPK